MAEKKQVKKRSVPKGRPKPNVPRAGYRSDGSRYEGGGKIKK